jgi:diaminopimelate epimerase
MMNQDRNQLNHRGESAIIHLTKHHGAGNDFLVEVDEAGGPPIDPALVRALCDRRFGVGADGFIRVSPLDRWADLSMELRNADGSVAEMSGNGIRCLAQAAVDHKLVQPPTFSVATLTGVRTIEYLPDEMPGSAAASVDMGEAVLGPDRPQQFGQGRAREVDMGNPHLVVVVDDPDEIDVAGLGRELQGIYDGGINVEFISIGSGGDGITLRVWERGVGETDACGTGSCAAAAAARSWDLVGETVDVHNPGGTLRVSFGPGGVTLAGPVRKVAEIEVDRNEILSAARP